MVNGNLVVEGKLVTSERQFYGQVHIRNGVIDDVIEDERGFEEADYVAGDEELVFPGFTDVHVHAREDPTRKQLHKEDYDTLTAAALRGGVACVGAMPNTPEPIVGNEQLDWHRKRVEGLDIDVFHYLGVGANTHPVSETVPYKIYTAESVGDLFCKHEAEVRAWLSRYPQALMSVHVEDYPLLESHEHAHDHCARRPLDAVVRALDYTLDAGKRNSQPLKLCHWNVGEASYDLIKNARDNGQPVYIEVSPLHLLFDADETRERPELWVPRQMNPALQTRQDRLDLWEALRTGFIDVLATDHAPHTWDEKCKNYAPHCLDGETPGETYARMLIKNPNECQRIAQLHGTSGTPQLDTYGLVACLLMQGREDCKPFRPEDVARVCAERPGEFVNSFHKGPGYGKMQAGYNGNLTVLDLGVRTTIRNEDVRSKVGWTPFADMDVKGRVAATIVRGEIKYQA